MTALEIIAERLVGLREQEALEVQDRINQPRSVAARYRLNGTRRVIRELEALAQEIGGAAA